MKQKVAFLTTIFPMEVEFLYDFFDSLKRQTFQDFHVIVINDGFKNFNNLKEKFSSLSIIELEHSDTPAKNREYGINWCKENSYDIIVFGDSDDFFSENRVRCSLEMLKTYDIIVNDLTLCSKNGVALKQNYISNRVRSGSIIKYDFIKDKNIFGLSNTALKTKIFDEKIEIEKDIVAADWFIYRKLLSKGAQAVFVNDCTTFYRQHDTNTVGLSLKEGEYPFWWENNYKD